MRAPYGGNKWTDWGQGGGSGGGGHGGVGWGGGCNTRLPPTLFLVFGRVTQIPALEFRFLLSNSDEQSSVAAAIV